jgi:hypothetical protein
MVTVREERFARLRAKRLYSMRAVREVFAERHTIPRSVKFLREVVRDIRSIDAKIAHLTALTTFERQTIVRACQHIHGGVRSPLFDALHDVEARVKL